MQIKTTNKGFTLLEILLVIALIGILVSILLIAINPNRQLAEARNLNRRSHITDVYESLETYSVRNAGVILNTITTSYQEICDTGTRSGTDSLPDANYCNGKLDLRVLVPTYITSIPKDNQATGTGNTGYEVAKDNRNQISIRATKSELGEVVAVNAPSDTLYSKADAFPNLDLNFASNKSLIDNVSGKNLITFARNSIGTYVGSDGLIKTAVANEARFDHNPTTGESLGLLVEESRINYHRYSTNFANWTSNSGASTITPTMDVIDPFGGTGAYVLNGWMHRNSEPGPGSGSSFRFRGSVFVKRHPLGRNILDMALTAGGGDSGISINFDTETVTTSGQSPQNPTIQKYPNGWYRIGLSITPGSTSWRPVLGSTPSTDTYWYVFGVQIENGLFDTSYIPTSGSTVTRSADVASITGTNFSSWYNPQREGTMFFNHNLNPETQFGNPSNTMIVAFSTGLGNFTPATTGLWGSGNNRYFPTAGPGWSGNSSSWFVRKDIVTSSGVTLADSGFDKYAMAYKVGTQLSNLAINGTLLGSRNMEDGYTPTGLYFAGGHNQQISRITYWPTRLPNSNLQAMTQ